jgi:hypothetical protein
MHGATNRNSTLATDTIEGSPYKESKTPNLPRVSMLDPLSPSARRQCKWLLDCSSFACDRPPSGAADAHALSPPSKARSPLKLHVAQSNGSAFPPWYERSSERPSSSLSSLPSVWHNYNLGSPAMRIVKSATPDAPCGFDASAMATTISAEATAVREGSTSPALNVTFVTTVRACLGDPDFPGVCLLRVPVPPYTNSCATFVALPATALCRATKSHVSGGHDE